MEKEIIFYIVAIMGVLFHLIVKFRDSKTKKEIFDWNYHLVFTAFSAFTAILLVFFKPSIEPFIPEAMKSFLSLNNLFLWFLIGYFSDSLWKNIENTGKDKLNINP